MNAWQTTWQRLSARERMLLTLAAAVVALALVLGLGLRPALRTLGSAPAELAQLDGHLLTMRAQADEAARIRQQPLPSRQQALATLESGLRQRLGAGAAFNMLNERVTVSLRGVPAEALGPWLAQVRVALGAVIEQIDLRRGPEGWDGTVVLVLAGAA